MATVIYIPDDINGEIIKYLTKKDLLNLRCVSKYNKSVVSKYGKVLLEVHSLHKLQNCIEKNNNIKLFKKICFNLHIFNLHITEDSTNLIDICTILKVNNYLHIFDISFSKYNIGLEVGKSISEALKVNNSLHTLNIYHNNIGPESGMAIGEALQMNNSLHNLDISFNNIRTEGGIAIGKALIVNTYLHKLNISSNNIRSKDKRLLFFFKWKRITFFTHMNFIINI